MIDSLAIDFARIYIFGAAGYAFALYTMTLAPLIKGRDRGRALLVASCACSLLSFVWFRQASQVAINVVDVGLVSLGLLSAFAIRRKVFRLYPFRDSKVATPPGHLALSAARALLRKSTCDLVVQAVADMRVEYFDALQAGRPLRAHWIRLLHYVAIVRMLTVSRALSAAIDLAVRAIGKP